MLYLECNCNHTSASCFCDHSPLWGGRGREGKIGTPLHQLFYNMHGISSLSLLAGCYYPNCPRTFSCTMAKWETSQLSRSSSDTESQEERDVHTPRTPIQNVNLSYSSTSSNASPVQTPKTKEINRLREETGAWRNNWNKLWVCSLTGIPNMMMMMSKMPMGGIKIGAKIMTEKVDQTVTGLAQSRDLFESDDEDNLKRSQSTTLSATVMRTQTLSHC